MAKQSRSIYVDDVLWQEVAREAGDANISLLVTKLLKMWLQHEVKVILEPATPAARLNRDTEKFID